jgi:hypothetical protein
MGKKIERPPIYGLMAEFDDPDRLLAATKKAHADGYREMDAYSPFPVHHLAEALGHNKRQLPWLVFAAASLGALAGYALQYFATVIYYPINIGGKPLHSWPAFIPVTFELTILGGAAAAVVGMLVLNGLPMPYHPVFNAPGFERASKDKFFLCIESSDPRFSQEDTKRFLEGLDAQKVVEVAH